MPSIKIHVSWNPTSRHTFEVDSEQGIGEIIGQIKDRLGLPDTDSQGEQIEYRLYTLKDDQSDILIRPKLGTALNGAELRLGNRQAPWWKNVAGPLPSKPSSKADPSPTVRPNPLGSSCRLVLSAGCLIDVPPEGLRVSRTFLIKKLQASDAGKVGVEKLKSFTGFRSRLSAVSREMHCSIYRQGDQWLLRADKPTYVHGREIKSGSTVVISQTTKIIVGREGWPIEIQIVAI